MMKLRMQKTRQMRKKPVFISQEQSFAAIPKIKCWSCKGSRGGAMLPVSVAAAAAYCNTEMFLTSSVSMPISNVVVIVIGARESANKTTIAFVVVIVLCCGASLKPPFLSPTSLRCFVCASRPVATIFAASSSPYLRDKLISKLNRCILQRPPSRTGRRRTDGRQKGPHRGGDGVHMGFLAGGPLSSIGLRSSTAACDDAATSSASERRMQL